MFAAQHRATGQKVALKVFCQELFNEEVEDICGPEQEFEALRACSGVEQVLQVVELIKDGDISVIVTELMEGDDLINFAEAYETETIDERTLKRIVRQIATGLSHIHDRGIVHRDLKLENIFMKSSEFDSKIVIGDFGFAVSPNENGTCAGRLGSRGYTAPEVLMGEDYDF